MPKSPDTPKVFVSPPLLSQTYTRIESILDYVSEFHMEEVTNATTRELAQNLVEIESLVSKLFSSIITELPESERGKFANEYVLYKMASFK